MIEARRILSIGVDCSKSRGGVSAVEYQYSKIYYPWQFIATATVGSSIKKAFYFITGLLRFLIKMLTDKKIEIIHVHGASYNSFRRKQVIINIGLFFKKKVIFHCHGAEFKLFTSSHKDSVIKTLKKCHCIVCLSESWKQWFENECCCKNVVHINNIIPIPQKGIREKNATNSLKLLFLGKLGKRKGIFDLLDVISQMREYDVKLFCGGNGDVDGVLKRISELKLQDKIEYLGWVSGEQKISLLNDVDAYVLPSYNEGLPISILEAMSYGLPIVSTRVGGIPDLVREGENGYLIDPGSKEQLYAALLSLMNNPEERIRMGQECEKVSLDYQPQNVEKQLKQMYQSL
jgi:glycosyltransferase involved in cell wall biosynthesis